MQCVCVVLSCQGGLGPWLRRGRKQHFPERLLWDTDGSAWLAGGWGQGFALERLQVIGKDCVGEMSVVCAAHAVGERKPCLGLAPKASRVPRERGRGEVGGRGQGRGGRDHWWHKVLTQAGGCGCS